MSNEIVWTYASPVTLEQSGESCASDSFVAADNDTLASGDHANFPWADFVLTCNFGAQVAAGGFVRFYRQALNIDGAGASPAPATTYPLLYIGSFVIPDNAAGTSFRYPLTDLKLIADQQYFLENKTNQTIGAAWSMKATPKTYEPAT